MRKNTMSVKAKMTSGYAVALIASLVVVVALLCMMSNQSSGYRKIIDTNEEAYSALLDTRLQANIAERCLRYVVMYPEMNSLNEKEQLANEAINQMNASLQVLKDTYPLSDTTLLNSYVSAVNSWYTAGESAMNAAMNGDLEGASLLIRDSDTPALLNMETYGEQLETALISAKDGHRHRMGQRAHEHYGRYRGHGHHRRGDHPSGYPHHQEHSGSHRRGSQCAGRVQQGRSHCTCEI
jgi:hypothetical protein